MRFAFVLRLGSDSRPADGFFEGWIEEVDSYTELRFRSTDELLKFLGDRFELSNVAGNRDQATVTTKTAAQKTKRTARAVRKKQNSGGDL
jgi:hypothetical protein